MQCLDALSGVRHGASKFVGQRALRRYPAYSTSWITFWITRHAVHRGTLARFAWGQESAVPSAADHAFGAAAVASA